MAVPAHDERDYEFAKKYDLTIKQVIEGDITEGAFTGDDAHIESDFINGMNNANASNQAMQNTMPQSAAAAPPPIPTAAYHIAVNGQTTGPYDMNTMAQLAANGQLTAETLVWKNGMASWARADSVAELVSLVSRPVPPPIPTI